MSRYGQQAPVDPGIEWAQRFADLEAKVAELQRLLSLPASRVLAIREATATTTTSASGTEVAITATSGLSPIITATLATGRRYRIGFQARFSSTVDGDIALVRLLTGSTQLSLAVARVPNQAVGETIVVFDHLDGDGASHVLSVSMARGVGTGTVSAVATATTPIVFWLEDVGPAV